MIKHGDIVEVYRNMPHLPEYPEAVQKGIKGTVDRIVTKAPPEVGKWVLVISENGRQYSIKFTYLKKVK